MNLQLTSPPPRPPLNHRHIPAAPPLQCGLTKKGHRFLTSITTTSSDNHHHLLRKFVSSSSKHVSLTLLSHLLSTSTTHPKLSSITLPLYREISEATWFDWNAKLVAQLIANLYGQERFDEAESFDSETVSRLINKERDLCNFYCHCVEFSSKNGCSKGILEYCKKLKGFVLDSSSVYVKRRAYESMISGLCVSGLVFEAEGFMLEMKDQGLKPSSFEYRSLVYAYGKAGLFEDMKKSIARMENEGFELDTICCNMVLSSLGSHNELQEMILWLQRMKDLDIPLSVRSYNTVLNSCPNLMLMLETPKSIPISIQKLAGHLSGSETKLVEELITSSSSLMEEATEWGSSELKLDLHGMHLGSAYLIFLKWLSELRHKCLANDCVFPTQITVVCGLGKHSNIRGESPVKRLIREMIDQMNCPLRIDRKNLGCFIARGSVFQAWLR